MSRPTEARFAQLSPGSRPVQGLVVLVVVDDGEGRVVDVEAAVGPEPGPEPGPDVTEFPPSPESPPTDGGTVALG